jgi:WD40 repeat protein
MTHKNKQPDSLLQGRICVLRYALTVLIVCLSGCSGFTVSQGPEVKLHEVHPFGARRVAFSPDGTLLASGGLQGEVQIWSVPTGNRLALLKDHGRRINGLLWIDGKHLLSADAHGKILVWDTGSQSVTAALHTEPLTSVAWLSSPEQLIVGYAAGQLRSFSYPGLKQISQTDAGSRVLSVTTGPASRQLAVSTANRRVQLFDSRLLPLKTMQEPPGKTFGLRFSPDGRQLAGGGWFDIFLWSTETGQLQVRDTGHHGLIIALDYSPDGGQMVSIGRITDANVLLTDTASGNLNRRLATQPLCGWDVRFSPDGRYIASSSEDGSLQLYDITIPYKPAWYHEPLP